MNWEAWTLDMCDLLDRIETVADEPEKVRCLTAGRFVLAEKHGAVVEVMEPITGWIQ